MISTRLALVATASTLVLAGCQYWPWHKDKPAPVTEAEAPVTVLPVAPEAEPAVQPAAEEAAPVEQACDILGSSGWEAWINKMPGVGTTPTLHVIGKVEVRTGGYTFEWKEGPMDRSAIPTLRLKLVPVPPEGMAMQAITTEDVKYEAPALASGYSGVIISCNGTVLAEITDITDAH